MDKVYYPGEIEYITEQQRSVEGIDVEDATWKKLGDLAEKFGCAKELDLG